MVVPRFRIVVLASGRGSNLAALIRATQDGTVPADIAGVFSDKRSAGALAIAEAAGIPAFAFAPKSYADRAAFDDALFAAVDAMAPDLIVLAGFMRILSPAVVARHAGRMINIHPSLLPKYPGLDTHRRAIDAGDSEHGASVHWVIPELDAGAVIDQVRLRIDSDDTPESLAARLLPLEHALLVRSVAALASGELPARRVD